MGIGEDGARVDARQGDSQLRPRPDISSTQQRVLHGAGEYLDVRVVLATCAGVKIDQRDEVPVLADPSSSTLRTKDRNVAPSKSCTRRIIIVIEYSAMLAAAQQEPSVEQDDPQRFKRLCRFAHTHRGHKCLGP